VLLIDYLCQGLINHLVEVMIRNIIKQDWLQVVIHVRFQIKLAKAPHRLSWFRHDIRVHIELHRLFPLLLLLVNLCQDEAPYCFIQLKQSLRSPLSIFNLPYHALAKDHEFKLGEIDYIWLKDKIRRVWWALYSAIQFS
jgi:hypothetical protein